MKKFSVALLLTLLLSIYMEVEEGAALKTQSAAVAAVWPGE